MSTPVIRLSDSARRALQEAAVDAGGEPLRIQVSDRFEYDLLLGSRAEGDLDVDCGGITILLDPSSAQRADGLSIDFVSGPDGAGFTIENPNEPPRVRQMSATERAVAKIEGSRLLNEEGHHYLLSLDRNTTIVFHCHHGIRSQSAAGYFLREKGFRNLYNLRGAESTPGPSSWIRACPATEIRPTWRVAHCRKDVDDLKFGLSLGVDMVALSFAQSAADLDRARRVIQETNGGDVPLVAKLERPQALDRLDEIFAACEALFVPPLVADGAVVRRNVPFTAHPRPDRHHDEDPADAIPSHRAMDC